MAYSDYGGYAYRNGVRVEVRSDFTLTPDGIGFGTPGMYPGFALVLAGKSKEEIEKISSYPRGHVVLGDGPIVVTMLKQTSTQIYRGFDEVLLTDAKVDGPDGVVEITEFNGKTFAYLDHDKMFASGKPVRIEIDGHAIEIFYEDSDNWYQFVKLTQPDGTVWTGFSGYGVGAGLEDAGYGYSTSDCESALFALFPAAPKDPT